MTTTDTRARVALAAIFVGSGFATGAAAQTLAPSVPKVGACSVLTGMNVESGIVEGAERFSEGEAIVGGATNGAAKAAGNLCRVRLRLQPVASSDIKVEVWLPDTWNKSLYGFGGGGFDGGLPYVAPGAMNKPISQGYAAAATDAGHTPAPSLESWANQREKVVDFGHRGNHLAAVVAKQVIATYYGAPVRHAYFVSCSNGGRDALMEVSRYPDDYDAVIAGAPARRYLEILTQLTWHNRTVHGPGGASNLEAKLNLIHDAIMKKCDQIDGVKDGILENPQLCQFDPGELQCKGADASTCMTSAEVRALRKLYAGPMLRDGKLVIHGPALGSERIPGGWTEWVTTPKLAFVGQEFYRWMVYDNPAWMVENFDLDRDYPAARAHIASVINADNADLRAFAQRGGKLIMYQGWNDPVITPRETIKYYEEVRQHLGAAADDHVRLFMVPGMGHCGGGPGATSFDMQPELERWVERGQAPERVIAVNPESAQPFSRPLCAWPKTAHYNGSGSTNDAANFTCKASRS